MESKLSSLPTHPVSPCAKDCSRSRHVLAAETKGNQDGCSRTAPPLPAFDTVVGGRSGLQLPVTMRTLARGPSQHGQGDGMEDSKGCFPDGVVTS